MNRIIAIPEPTLIQRLIPYGFVGAFLVVGILIFRKKGKFKKIFGIALIAIGLYFAYQFYTEFQLLKHIQT